MESEVRATSPSSSNRSRNLSFRRKARAPKHEVVHKEEVEVDSQSDSGRLKILLENLDIRFVDCTFTYKQSHFDAAPSTSSRRRSKLASLRSRIFNSIERMREAVACEKTFNNNCLYIPIEETAKVKEFIWSNFSEVKLSFDGCKFIKRSTTFSEKVTRKLRNFFGIQFELEYIHSTATINNYTFRIKDILFVNQHIQERIVEEA